MIDPLANRRVVLAAAYMGRCRFRPCGAGRTFYVERRYTDRGPVGPAGTYPVTVTPSAQALLLERHVRLSLPDGRGRGQLVLTDAGHVVLASLVAERLQGVWDRTLTP